MSFDQNGAIEKAKEDLAMRLNIQATDIETAAVIAEEFPDASLGAPVEDEMSAQMISGGWRITLKVNNDRYEYRADKYQLRIVGFNGKNIVVVS